jgi:hypothetical protein
MRAVAFTRLCVRVDEWFGGLAEDVREGNVLTGRGGGDCGVPFRAGDAYLVSAFSEKDGLLQTSICSAPRKTERADAALQVLRLRRDARPAPSLTGRIARIDRNFHGLLGTDPPQPLANALVRVKADGQMYETRADG